MNQQELFAALRLQKCKAIGSILAKKLIVNTGSASQVFREKKSILSKINGIGSNALKHLFDETHLEAVAQELRFIDDHKISYTYFTDSDFPQHLHHCVDSPILLFKDGAIDLKDKRILAIVGTRNISSYGRSFCKNLIAELQPFNPVIVSGFAYGVDICAHKAAIDNGLQTVAVLAHGFKQIYPKVHKKHMHQVLENGGFYTEFGFEENPLRENFLKRNRIVAGMSEATIVIESAEKGGSLVTADIANSYNREVFALPGRASDVYSKGCNELIKHNKANVLTSAADIIRVLNWDVSKKKAKNIQKKLFVELDEQQQKVYDVLHAQGCLLLDAISMQCNIPIFQLSSILLQMELKGVVNPLPGKLFELS